MAWRCDEGQILSSRMRTCSHCLNYNCEKLIRFPLFLKICSSTRCTLTEQWFIQFQYLEFPPKFTRLIFVMSHTYIAVLTSSAALPDVASDLCHDLHSHRRFVNIDEEEEDIVVEMLTATSNNTSLTHHPVFIVRVSACNCCVLFKLIWQL